MRPHLQPEEFEAMRAGQQVDSAVKTHLNHCEACRAQLNETRLVDALLAPSETETVQGHPDRDELTGLHDHALDPDRAREVETHLGECSTCLAMFVGLRRQTEKMETVTPPGKLVAAVQRRFRRRPNRRLGLLKLAGLKTQVLRLLWFPATALPAELEPGADRSSTQEIAAQYAPPNVVESPAMDHTYGPTHEGEEAEKEPLSLAMQRRGRGRSEVFEVEAPPYHVEIEITLVRLRADLTVTLTEGDSGREGSGVPITVIPSPGPTATLVTDAAGKARLRVSAMCSARLVIEGDEVWEIQIDTQP